MDLLRAPQPTLLPDPRSSPGAVTPVTSYQFYCPGSLLALDVDTSHPLAFGMPARTAAFFASSAAFHVPAEAAGAGIRVPARYGEGNPLLSGWLEGGERLAGQPAVVDIPVGEGRVVLIGFRVQHRGQSHGTFRLFFNALLTAAVD